MAESINVLPISADSVRLFLNWDEIKETRYLESNIFTNDTVLPDPVVFKDFGEIYKTGNFRLHVIFRDGSYSISRDYKFILRTYSHDWEIVDSYDLAVWNEKVNKYCFGSINNKLIIKKRSNNSDIIEIMQITNNGKIIASSFHKP
jgi:hypothetical protein